MPPPLPPWWLVQCDDGYEPNADASRAQIGECVPCPAGTKQETDSLSGRQQCRVCENGYIQPYPAQIACLQCDPLGQGGINCRNKAEIDLLPGYYMSAQERVTDITAWRCAREDACAGGILSANETGCAPGHEGVLCGACMKLHYRGRLRCEPCANFEGRAISVQQTVTILIVYTLIIAGLAAVYLMQDDGQPTRTVKWVQQCTGKFWKGRLVKLLSLSHARLITSSTLFRILLGFSQCISMGRRYLRVRWPKIFLDFLAGLDQVSPIPPSLHHLHPPTSLPTYLPLPSPFS